MKELDSIIKLTIVLALFIASCTNVEQSKTTNTTSVDLIAHFINSDDFYYDDSTYIIPEFSSHEYYEPEIINGLEAPPPGQLSYLNENKIARSIASKDYFESDQEIEFLKEQILNSNEISASLNLNQIEDKIDLRFINESSSIWINFYVPLYNLDSTVAYLQYNYYDYGYEEGAGIILARKDTTWKVEGIVKQWEY